MAHSTFAAAQKAAGAATSGKPTAPPGSALNKLQIQFDPASTGTDIPRGVSGFQLTVSWNSLQLALESILPIYNNPFIASSVAISQPYTQRGSTGSITGGSSSTTLDTFVTVYGTTKTPVYGDVDIFSLVFIPNSVGSTLPLAPVVGIMESDHSLDILPPGQAPMGPDYILLTDPHNLSDTTSVGPGAIETTVITSQFGLNPSFVTLQGNSPLIAGVPLPAIAWGLMAGLGVLGLFRTRLRIALAT